MCSIGWVAMNANGVNYVPVQMMYSDGGKRHSMHEHVAMMAEPVAAAARPHSNETIAEYSMAGRSMKCRTSCVRSIYSHVWQRWPLVVVVVVVTRKCSLWISVRSDCAEIYLGARKKILLISIQLFRN